MSESLWRLSALEAKAKLESGDITSQALVGACLERIDAVDASVNAVIHRFDLRARERAREADEARERGESWGPLHGLPITIKESMATAGLAVTLGIENRRGNIESEDAVTAK